MAELNKVVVGAVHRRGPVAIFVLEVKDLFETHDDDRVMGCRWVGQNHPKQSA